MTTTTFDCPGCNQRHTHAAAGSIAILRGVPVGYMLCEKCADEVVRDPQPILARIELALTRPEGHA